MKKPIGKNTDSQSNVALTTKILTSLFIFVFIFSNMTVFAQMPVAASGAVSSLVGLPRIGVVAAIQGKVEVMTPGSAGRIVQSGEEIFVGDEVKTDALGHLQILLLDETVFTIGPNSAITIDKFIYDPGTHVGKVEASIAKGVFRYVSGKIAANKPENVSIKLPTATIGIRGTIVAGEVSATSSMAMLLGPGSKNETGAIIGSFVMNGTGANSGQQEHVDRTGFGVSVDQTGSVSSVFMVPEVQVQHLGEALLPAQGRGPTPVGGENAPQGTSPAGRTFDQSPPGARSPNPPAPGMAPGTHTPSLAAERGPANAMTMPSPASTMGGATAGRMPMETRTVTAPAKITGAFGARFNAGLASGAQTFASFQMTKMANMMGMLQTGLMQDTTIAAQEAAHTAAVQTTNQTIRNTLRGDMLGLPASLVTYEHFGAPFMFHGSEASLNVKIIFDVTNQVLLGGSVGSKIEILQGASIVDKCQFAGNQAFTDPNFAKAGISGTAIQQFGPTAYDGGNFNGVMVQFQDIVKQSADPTLPSTVDIAAQAKVTVDYGTSHTTGEVIAPQQ